MSSASPRSLSGSVRARSSICTSPERGDRSSILAAGRWRTFKRERPLKGERSEIPSFPPISPESRSSFKFAIPDNGLKSVISFPRRSSSTRSVIFASPSSSSSVSPSSRRSRLVRLTGYSRPPMSAISTGPSWLWLNACRPWGESSPPAGFSPRPANSSAAAPKATANSTLPAKRG